MQESSPAVQTLRTALELERRATGHLFYTMLYVCPSPLHLWFTDGCLQSLGNFSLTAQTVVPENSRQATVGLLLRLFLCSQHASNFDLYLPPAKDCVASWLPLCQGML